MLSIAFSKRYTRSNLVSLPTLLNEICQQSTETGRYFLEAPRPLFSTGAADCWQETGLVKAIDNLTNTNTLLWIKSSDGTILAKSATVNVHAERTDAALISLTEMPLSPQLYEVNGRFFVLCGSPLLVKGTILSKLYVAQYITREQMMFLAMVRRLGIPASCQSWRLRWRSLSKSSDRYNLCGRAVVWRKLFPPTISSSVKRGCTSIVLSPQ